jgi:anti-sigma regulatory factor (Ser/Thr protein kinase)
MDCTAGLLRKPWELPFVAEPEEVSRLRRFLRSHLELWRLSEATDAAQLCVSELVSNVITHVGLGTPAMLAVSMNGRYLRIEVHDPDTRALPALLDAGADSEAGRGVALVDALADRWGVQLFADFKVIWCELGTEVPLDENAMASQAQAAVPRSLSATIAGETAISLIADLLRWLRLHGWDADDVLDRAQIQFEAEVAEGNEISLDRIRMGAHERVEG